MARGQSASASATAGSCFSIVGGGVVYTPIQAAANVAPPPTESVAAWLIHEVFVQNGAVEPQTVARNEFFPAVLFPTETLPKVSAKCCRRDQARENRIGRNLSLESITRFIGQLSPECRSIKDFLGESLRSSEIGDGHPVNRAMFGLHPFSEVIAMTKFVRCDADDWQLKSPIAALAERVAASADCLATAIWTSPAFIILSVDRQSVRVNRAIRSVANAVIAPSFL